MLEKLDDRSYGHSTASKIRKMSELVSVRFYSVNPDMTKHVDKMEAFLEQRRSMKAVIDESQSLMILIALIDTPKFTPVIAEINTL